MNLKSTQNWKTEGNVFMNMSFFFVYISGLPFKGTVCPNSHNYFKLNYSLTGESVFVSVNVFNVHD